MLYFVNTMKYIINNVQCFFYFFAVLFFFWGGIKKGGPWKYHGKKWTETRKLDKTRNLWDQQKIKKHLTKSTKESDFLTNPESN